MMENSITLPFLGPSCFKYQLSMLIVSQNKLYREILSKSLYQHHHHQYELSLHTTNNINNIIQQLDKLGAVSIDFIIILLDTNTIQCIDWTEQIIKQIHSDFMPGRTVLVNGSGLPTLEMAISLDSITEIRRRYKLQLLNGNLNNKSDSDNIAKRILVLIDTVMGFNTGLPHIVNMAL